MGRGWTPHARVFLSYLALAFGATLPGSMHLDGALLGDGRDAFYFVWDHWWFA